MSKESMLQQDIVLQANGLAKHFKEGGQTLTILDGVDLRVSKGESIAIVGASGAGKTTLLNLLGGLDAPSKGEVLLAGHSMLTCSDRQRDILRNRHLGFVYQLHHLLAEFSAIENVAMPLLIRGESRQAADQAAAAMLAHVNLDHRKHHKPAQLSGGERQRVAIARALVGQPGCVLMDEPTGNLDPKNAAAVWELMTSLMQNLHTSFVVVTHDEQLANKMDRVLFLENGRLQQHDD